MNQERLYKVIVGPHISEKATVSAEKSGQIVFKVLKDATKIEVKSAVEAIFEVKVESVNVLNVKGKAKMFGKVAGRKSDYKKAYVKLQPGQDIDFSGMQV